MYLKEMFLRKALVMGFPDLPRRAPSLGVVLSVRLYSLEILSGFEPERVVPGSGRSQGRVLFSPPNFVNFVM